MQDFTLPVQDGVQCLVVAVLLFHGFILHFASIIADRLFADAVVERPDIEEQTRDPKKNEASRRGRNRPFWTTMTAWEPTTNAKYGVGKRTSDREPVFRDEKDDPFTRTSPITSVSFFAVIYNYEARSDRELTLKFGETVQILEQCGGRLRVPQRGPHPIFSFSLSLLGWYRGWSLSKKDVLVKFDAFLRNYDRHGNRFRRFFHRLSFI